MVGDLLLAHTQHLYKADANTLKMHHAREAHNRPENYYLYIRTQSRSDTTITLLECTL